MEYILIIILQFIGCGFHVLQKVREIDQRNPTDGLAEVFGVFLKEDRVTLLLSFFVLALNLVAHFIIGAYTDLPETYEYYFPVSFAIALVLGYAGQRLIYKALGRAEEVINKKIDEQK